MDRRFYLSTTAVTAASTGVMFVAVPVMAADISQATSFEQRAGDIFEPQPISGYIQAFGSIGSASYDDDLFDASLNRLGGAGRLNWWLSPSVSVQGDFYGSGFLYDSDGDEGTASAIGAAAHLTYRDPNSHAIGVMASVGQTTPFWGGGNRWGTVAIEGQWYHDNLTLYGQAGFTGHLSGEASESDPSSWYAALQGRYFVHSNFAVIADVTFSKMTFDGGSESFNGVGWGAGVEYKPESHPLAFFARYQGNRDDIGPPVAAISHEVMAGLKLFVNQPTLLANDRNGATLLDLNPQYGEFSAYWRAQ